ncbi:MAG: hypothetical protein SVJ22_02650 [Halobacteriota archaeon]|nr:hypothetical protein [Halobacteriota archaeon]
MGVKKLTQIDNFDRCVELMKKDGRGEITPIDVFRVDTIGEVYKELDRGYVIGSEINDELVGFSRVTATLEENIHWIHELFGECSKELFDAIKEEAQKRGGDEFVWLLKDEWLRELNELFEIEDNSNEETETLVHLKLDNMEIEKEEISLNDLAKRVYSEDPLVTNVTTFEELEACVKVQKDVGWGDVSAPIRVLKPEMLSEHFSVLTGLLLALKENGEVVAYVRGSATFQKGVFYGHEGAITSTLQSTGVGKFAVNLAGDIINSLLKNPLALEVPGRILKKVGSPFRIKIYGTIDPLNAKMLGLATSPLVTSIGAFSRGVFLARNLYGVWDTDAHGSAETDRIIWAGNLHKRRFKLDDYPVVRTEEELEGISEDSFYIELPEIDMDMADSESKKMVTRMLAKAINELGFNLTHVNSRGVPRYLMELE